MERATRPARPAALAAVLLVLLAGCASTPAGTSSGDEKAVEDAAAGDIQVEATADTGVIRGVVVDTGVRPLANVLVRVTGSGAAAKSANTTATGAFGFDGLAPGTYFVKASKPGYLETQRSVDVVAGVSDPPLTKIALEPNKSTQPYWRDIVNRGYIECSVTLVFYGVAACSIGPLGGVFGDIFLFENPVDRLPTHLQSEMIWTSTQRAGAEMTLVWSYGCESNGGLLCDPAQAAGTSPLLLRGNETILRKLFQDEGNRSTFLIRVFNADLQETRPPPGTTQSVCVDTLVLGKPCARRGVGLTLEQPFQVYSHVFYGYVPPEWRFSEGKPVPNPPA